jgi:hypothetical protein
MTGLLTRLLTQARFQEQESGERMGEERGDHRLSSSMKLTEVEGLEAEIEKSSGIAYRRALLERAATRLYVESNGSPRRLSLIGHISVAQVDMAILLT